MNKHRPVSYKDCKYNTSKSAGFVGYCDLPQYTTKTGKRLVECCKDTNCKDFVLRIDE